MDQSDRILGHTANTGIISCLKYLTQNWRGPISCHPDEAHDPYYQLGTHPDLVERLWDTLASPLPADCRWVLFARPVLLHPQTGIVFAFATGSMTYGFRVPDPFRSILEKESISQVHEYPDGTHLDLGDFDSDWIIGGHMENEQEVCLAAFQAASEQDPGGSPVD